MPGAGIAAEVAADIAVVYLCRGVGRGLASARRFLRSYADHPAGEPHRLIAVMKGWDDAGQKAEAEALVRAQGGAVLDLPDDGFDFGAYFRAAGTIDARWTCVLNTHSELLTRDWLRMLLAAAESAGVGAAGATGSFACMAPRLSMYPPMLRRLRETTPLPTLLLRGAAALLIFYPAKRWIWRKWPVFPNPNLRTNAFLMQTDLLRAFGQQSGIPATKTDAWSLESGHRSLTRWLAERDLTAVVVDRRGRVHAPRDWPESGTFRVPGQPNLLVADNQTRGYDSADPWSKRMLEIAAWGRSAIDAKPDRPGDRPTSSEQA